MSEKTRSVDKVREIALDLLLKTHGGKVFSNQLFETAVSEKGLGERDTGFLKALYFGVLRQSFFLDHFLSERCTTPLQKLPLKIAMILRLGLYQIFFMDRVPLHASIGESVNLARKHGHKGTAGLVNAVLRRLSENRPGVEDIKIVNKGDTTEISWKRSHPEWIVKKYIADFGFEKAIEIFEANNKLPSLNYRALLPDKLASSGVLVRKNIFNDLGVEIDNASVQDIRKLMEGGVIAPQDQSSLIAVSLLSGRGGNVLELCSGRGNKTSALLKVLGKGARIISADISFNKLAAAGKGPDAASLSVCADASKPLPFKSGFENIFIDLPCSNMGVIRRHPEIKHNRALEEITKAAELQRTILKNSAEYVVKGGALVYAVCSIEKEETFEVVERFLSKDNTFEAINISALRPDLEAEGLTDGNWFRVFPGEHGMDGMFAAMLRKR